MTAPKVFGNGASNFGSVIGAAKSLSVSLVQAERYGSNKSAPGKSWRMARAVAVHRDVSRIAAEARMSMDEAWELQQRAKSGDQDARTQIREARGRVRCRGQVDEELHEEEVACELMWDDSAGQLQNPQAKQNTTNAGEDVQGVQCSEEPKGDSTFEPAEVMEPVILDSCASPNLVESMLACLRRAPVSSKKKTTNVAAHVAGNSSR